METPTLLSKLNRKTLLVPVFDQKLLIAVNRYVKDCFTGWFLTELLVCILTKRQFGQGYSYFENALLELV